MLIIRNIGAIRKIMGFMSSCVLIFLLSIAITIISLKLSEMYDIYTFADGAPFGMKEE